MQVKHVWQIDGGWQWLALVAGLMTAILLPWWLFGDLIARLATDTAAALAGEPWLVLALVAGLLALDPVLPVPSSIVAVAGGSALGAGLGALAIWLGLTGGTLFGFWLGRRPARFVATRLLGLDALVRPSDRLGGIGPALLILSRPVPVVAEAVVILAGATGLSWRVLILATLPANAVLAGVWAGLGAVAAASDPGPALIGALALPALAHACWQVWRRR